MDFITYSPMWRVVPEGIRQWGGQRSRIGAGALLGGFTAHHVGLPWIGVVGGVLALAGLGWCVFAMRKFPVMQATAMSKAGQG
jgi:hypothetical protein